MTAAITNPGAIWTAAAIAVCIAAYIAYWLWERSTERRDGEPRWVPMTEHTRDEAARLLRRMEEQ